MATTAYSLFLAVMAVPTSLSNEFQQQTHCGQRKWRYHQARDAVAPGGLELGYHSSSCAAVHLFVGQCRTGMQRHSCLSACATPSVARHCDKTRKRAVEFPPPASVAAPAAMPDREPDWCAARVGGTGRLPPGQAELAKDVRQDGARAAHRLVICLSGCPTQ